MNRQAMPSAPSLRISPELGWKTSAPLILIWNCSLSSLSPSTGRTSMWELPVLRRVLVRRVADGAIEEAVAHGGISLSRGSHRPHTRDPLPGLSSRIICLILDVASVVRALLVSGDLFCLERTHGESRHRVSQRA